MQAQPQPKEEEASAQKRDKQKEEHKSSGRSGAGSKQKPSPGKPQKPSSDKPRASSPDTKGSAGGGAPLDVAPLWRQWEGSWLREAAANSCDAWVWASGQRESLIPLSGAVPFNGEPSLTDLFAAGLVTPTKLHHVRNHGPAPRIDPKEFRLQIGVEEEQQQKPRDKDEGKGTGKEQQQQKQEPESEGDDDNPAVHEKHLRTWTLDELRALPSLRILVTLSCDGVRRKELNMLEHSKGFNTGPGATSTSCWTGALLSDVLRQSGLDVDQLLQEDRFLCFEGLDDHAKGKYGTSLPCARALDPTGQVMVAWAQNDEPLTPDHGAPLRLIVPGNVGGRSVKWLGRVTLSNQPSRLLSHNEDNMQLPSSVSLSQWNSGKYFGRQEFIIYEHLINSTIVKPAHEEWIDVSEDGGVGGPPIRVEGFAFAGGGRRVLRVEVSPDGGTTWLLATLKHADVEEQRKKEEEEKQKQGQQAEGKDSMEEQPSGSAGGGAGPKKPDRSAELTARAYASRSRCWSWCFWSVDVPSVHLCAGSPSSSASFTELCVRACDESYATQPRELRWNPLGMMNNAWYKLRVETRRPSGAHGPTYLRFEHPVLAGAEVGGWMKPGPAALAPAKRLDQSAAMARGGPLLGIAAHRAHKLIAREEVERHRSEDDCWFVMDGVVYDVSCYMREHPGGSAALLSATRIPSADLSALFRSIHAADAYEITGRFAIGYVAPLALIQALDEYYGGPTERHTRDERGTLTGSQKKFFIGDGQLQHSGGEEEEDEEPEEPEQVPEKEQPHAVGESAKSEGKAKGKGKSKGGLPRVNLGSSKESLQHLHRRSHWQERPDPSLRHPSSGLRLFPSPGAQPRRTFLLHSSRWCPVTLLAVREVSHDTKLFTFGAKQHAFDAVGLTTGQHLLLSAMIKGEQVVRPYTPVWPVAMDEDAGGPLEEGQPEQPQSDEAKEAQQQEEKKTAAQAQPKRGPQRQGQQPQQQQSKRQQLRAAAASAVTSERHPSARFELLIKIYRRHGGMPGGKLTQFLDTLTTSSPAQLRVLGPTGHVLYLGGGYFNIHGVGVRVQRLNLIGGGTGITPLWQLLRAILCLPSEAEAAGGVQLSLIYANKTEGDILMREQIDALAAAFPQRLRVVYILDQLPQSSSSDQPALSPTHAQQRVQNIIGHLQPNAQAQPQQKHSEQGDKGEQEQEQHQQRPNAVSSPKSASEAGRTAASSGSSGPPPSSSTDRPSPVSMEGGHVSAFLFRRHLFPPNPRLTRTFICGPPGMVDATLQHLLALNFTDECIIEF